MRGRAEDSPPEHAVEHVPDKVVVKTCHNDVVEQTLAEPPRRSERHVAAIETHLAASAEPTQQVKFVPSLSQMRVVAGPGAPPERDVGCGYVPNATGHPAH